MALSSSFLGSLRVIFLVKRSVEPLVRIKPGFHYHMECDKSFTLFAAMTYGLWYNEEEGHLVIYTLFAES